jgi:XTP/dITP diphosphohydrolase
MLLSDLSWEVYSLQDFPGLPEVEEDGKTFSENAVKKATAVAGHLKTWTIADDSGLIVDALDGAPGVHSARFAGEERDDAKNNEKLLKLLNGVPQEKRTARFCSALAFVSPEGEVWTTEGYCPGLITFAPRGENGFGYDPLFLLPELGLTMAELTDEQKNQISHRAMAMRNFRDYLATKFK